MAQQKYKSEPVKEGQKKSNIKHQSFGTQALPPPKPTTIIKTNKPMTQQTAVDWLVNHWKKLQSKGEKMSWQQIIDITELAKQMEEEEKKKVIVNGNNQNK